MKNSTIDVTHRATLVAQLEAIEDIEERIDEVAADFQTQKNLYAALDAFTLGELLGIEFENVEGRTQWGYKADFKDCCDDYKLANNRELLEPLVSEERYAELEAQAEEIDNGTRLEDLSLTEEERSALAAAYGEAHASSEGVATAIETVTSCTGIHLEFEVVFGPDGPEQAYSPYELRSGGGFDLSGYAALE